MNLFEGLDDDGAVPSQHLCSGEDRRRLATQGTARTSSQQQLRQAASVHGCCGGGPAGELLLWRQQGDSGDEPPVLLQLSAAHGDAAQEPGVVRLQAVASAATAPSMSSDGGRQLVCACAQPGAPGAILGLFKQQSSLQLCATGDRGWTRPLAAFQHPALAALHPRQCHLSGGGPLIVLQSPAEAGDGAQQQQQQQQHQHHQEALLLLLPSSINAAASDGSAASPHDPGWQAVELRLPAGQLLQQVAQPLPQQLHQPPPATPAADQQPWRLLHSSWHPAAGASSSVQLLLSLPLAQRECVLACLDVSIAAGGEVPPPRLRWCHVLPWGDEQPACAAVLEAPTGGSGSMPCSSSPRQQALVAVGGGAGRVQLLQVCSGGAGHAEGSASPVACCRLHAAANVQGAVLQVLCLPQAVVQGAGRTQWDVLAALHASGAEGSMAVTLLSPQGSALQRLAVVPDVLGLVAVPAGASAVVPWAAQPQPDAPALHLAAAIVLQPRATSDDAPPSIPGLSSCAWLPAAAADGLPGPLLGLLAAPLPGLAPLQGDPTRAADSELQGLQAMLAVLETRWQHETRNLAALQHRLSVSRHMAAAAHHQLCVVAADRLQGSTARQYVVPLNSADPDAALAVYQAGRQAALQQQQQQQAASTGLMMQQQPVCADASGLHLSLQLLGASSGWAAGTQHNTVVLRLKPALHAPHSWLPPGQAPRHGSRSAGLTWRGALLQPCHAELLLWHESSSALTASSSWTWDPLTGELVVTGMISSATLMRVLQEQQQQQQPISTAATSHADSSCANSANECVGVAEAMAAAAAVAAAGAPHTASGPDAHAGGAVACSETLQLHGAVVVSACCSKQAIVQWAQQQQQEQEQPDTSSSRSSASGIARQAALLSPACALLHLQPLTVSVCDVLQRELLQDDGVSSVPCPPGAAGAVHAALEPAAALPAEQQQQHTPVDGLGSRLLSGGAQDVVPPTPFSCGNDDAGGASIIPDSEDADDAAHTHPTPQAAGRQAPAAALQPAATTTAAAAAAPPAVDPGAGRGGGGSQQQFMLTADDVAATHQQVSVLLQKLGGLAPVAHAQPQPCVVLHKGSATVKLACVADQAVLVELSAGSHSARRALHQLLLLTVARLQAAGDNVRLQASALDADVYARLAAAADAVTDATQLHVRVLEQTLLSMQDGSSSSDHQQDVAGRDQAGAAGKRARPASAAAAATQRSCMMAVDGVDVGPEFSECWLALLRAQADVDLAVSQLRCRRG